MEGSGCVVGTVSVVGAVCSGWVGLAGSEGVVHGVVLVLSRRALFFCLLPRYSMGLNRSTLEIHLGLHGPPGKPYYVGILVVR